MSCCCCCSDVQIPSSKKGVAFITFTHPSGASRVSCSSSSSSAAIERLCGRLSARGTAGCLTAEPSKCQPLSGESTTLLPVLPVHPVLCLSAQYAAGARASGRGVRSVSPRRRSHSPRGHSPSPPRHRQAAQGNWSPHRSPHRQCSLGSLAVSLVVVGGFQTRKGLEDALARGTGDPTRRAPRMQQVTGSCTGLGAD